MWVGREKTTLHRRGGKRHADVLQHPTQETDGGMGLYRGMEARDKKREEGRERES